MNCETTVNEWSKDGDDIVEAVVAHDKDDDMPYRITLNERWFTEQDLNALIRTLRELKRIRKTGAIR